jgi:hypothetical protein
VLELDGPARNEAIALDIVGRSVKELGAIEKLTETVVATHAEQPAYEVLVVVVIEVMALTLWLLCPTNRAAVSMGRRERLVLLHGESERPTQIARPVLLWVPPTVFTLTSVVPVSIGTLPRDDSRDHCLAILPI